MIYDGIFASFDPNSTTCSKFLHRPEGLVFGPDGNLYVTVFTSVPPGDDVDKILVFDIEGNCNSSRVINLWQPGEPRKFAQYLIFGPNNSLYVCHSSFVPP